MKSFSTWFAAAGICLGAGHGLAQEAAPAAKADRPPLRKAEGLVMLDYEVVPVPGGASIDLMGFHFLNRMNDWLYLGVGGYAPLFKGEYGGFMALDATAHVQRRLFGRFFADAGLSLGGGGGGKSVEQSKILSGTGGFYKAYVGLGHDFDDYAIGLNLAKVKFVKSAIEHSQLNVYLQVPFSYAVGAYASSGARLFSADPADDRSTRGDPGENTLALGLESYRQINPEGSNKGAIRVADLQFSHFMTKHSYWFASASVGYRGLPLYNQVLGGLGVRVPVSSRLNLYGQLALGSGGYAPEKIDTGPGLLVFPKVSAEYLLDRNFGLSLSAGYLLAPKGSSKNYTFGGALNYHIHSGGGSAGAGAAGEGTLYRGYRIHLFPQTEFNVKDGGTAQTKINMISVQLDNLVNEHVYIPLQISVAYNAYLGYPGYGELLAGVGVQNRFEQDSRFQWFAQLLVGTNSRGPVLKPGIGVNVGLNDRLAVYGLVGQTFTADRARFKADYAGLGLTYRFSAPSR